LKPEAELRIERFLKAVGKAEQSLLLLDYDGTLAPFREERHQAFPYPRVARLLREIVCSGQTRVVIISGRDTSETIPLLSVEPTPEVWGLHGLQRRLIDGSVQTVEVDQRYLDALFAAERWLGYQQLRHRAEFKTGSIAVHWRGVSDRRVEELRGRVLLGWKPIAERSGLEFLDFDGGIEIRAPEADKGDVVRLLLSEMKPDTPAAYLGDDATDEHAFEAIGGRGLSILVRPSWRPTAAQLWLRPPEELLAFLTQWAKTIRGQDLLEGGHPVAVATG
jgi:trehalose 6-phosphate phosphatase